MSSTPAKRQNEEANQVSSGNKEEHLFGSLLANSHTLHQPDATRDTPSTPATAPAKKGRTSDLLVSAGGTTNTATAISAPAPAAPASDRKSLSICISIFFKIN
jgi:hypothetical protein